MSERFAATFRPGKSLAVHPGAIGAGSAGHDRYDNPVLVGAARAGRA